MTVAASFAAALLACSMVAPAVSSAPPELVTMQVDKTAVGDVVVRYPARLAKVIDKTFIVPEAEIKTVEVIRTRLSDASERYLVFYDEGPSVDPEFVLFLESGGERREVFRHFGLTLTIPGDGFVYLSGHTNNYFDTVRKFAVGPDGATEVKQPFYYVGISTTTKEAVELFDSPGLERVVTTVAKGEKVLVVVNQGNLYLVRAPNGLVGWVALKVDGTQTQFEGIVYQGD